MQEGILFKLFFFFFILSAVYLLQQDAAVYWLPASQNEQAEVCKLCESFSSFHVRQDSALFLSLSPTY